MRESKHCDLLVSWFHDLDKHPSLAKSDTRKDKFMTLSQESEDDTFEKRIIAWLAFRKRGIWRFQSPN